MSVTVGVATHKQYRFPKDSCYLPIEVGAALRPAQKLGYQRDDDGKSISTLNEYYCELTAIYWLWQNVDADYVGLAHYRRHFGRKRLLPFVKGDRYNYIATTETISAALTKADIVLPKRRNYVIETIHSHYSNTFTSLHFDIARGVIASKQPAYLASFDKVMNRRGAHMFNMFIMRKDLFSSYCAWLFPILDEVFSQVDATRYTAFEKRYVGRVSEVLLDVWIDANGYRYTELPLITTEREDWPKKIVNFLLAKFFNRKYTSSF